jgi:F420H(2)-dependent quinone reductase
MNLVEHIASWLSRGSSAPVIRVGSRIHRLLFRLGLGRFRLIGGDSLVLTTRGRKTGRETSTPVFYVAHGGSFYVAGSFAGRDEPPNWYLNLVAHPEVTIEVGASRRRCRARVLDPPQAAQVWPRLVAIYPTFADYQKRTARVIPVVALTPLVEDQARSPQAR